MTVGGKNHLTIEVGGRVHAQWLEPEPGMLSGTKFKLLVRSREVTGTIEKFVVVGLEPGSFDPDDPPEENVRAVVRPDEGGETVDVCLRHILDVLPTLPDEPSE